MLCFIYHDQAHDHTLLVMVRQNNANFLIEIFVQMRLILTTLAQSRDRHKCPWSKPNLPDFLAPKRMRLQVLVMRRIRTKVQLTRYALNVHIGCLNHVIIICMELEHVGDLNGREKMIQNMQEICYDVKSSRLLFLVDLQTLNGIRHILEFI